MNYNKFSKDKLNRVSSFNKESKVTDPTEIFAKVLDYILGRIPNRFNNLDECKNKFNELFEEAVSVVQSNYNRFFETELMGNLKNYGIEIMGGEPTIEKPTNENAKGEGNPKGNNEGKGNEEGPTTPGEETVEKMKDKGVTVEDKSAGLISLEHIWDKY